MSHIFDSSFVLTRREPQFVQPGRATVESGVLVLGFSFGSASVVTAGISAGGIEKPPTRTYEGSTRMSKTSRDPYDNRSLLNLALRVGQRQ